MVHRGLHAEFPDFEAVYHIVIDAVDSYNENWEKAFKDQELLKVCILYFVFLLFSSSISLDRVVHVAPLSHTSLVRIF